MISCSYLWAFLSDFFFCYWPPNTHATALLTIEVADIMSSCRIQTAIVCRMLPSLWSCNVWLTNGEFNRTQNTQNTQNSDQKQKQNNATCLLLTTISLKIINDMLSVIYKIYNIIKMRHFSNHALVVGKCLDQMDKFCQTVEWCECVSVCVCVL